MVANTGTYVDSPFHRYAEGDDLAALPLELLADLDALVVRQPFERGLAIDAAAFAGLDVRGRAVLVHTGWDRHWRTEAYFTDHPFLTEAAADWLAANLAAFVGIDSHNIDDTAHPRPPGPFDPARRGHPDRRASHQPRRVARQRFPFLGGPAQGQGHGDFPGARLRQARLTMDPIAPMEALLAEQLPDGDGWQYEPKWDGFRCIAARDGASVELWSKSGKPLARYFPEVAAMLGRLKAETVRARRRTADQHRRGGGVRRAPAAPPPRRKPDPQIVGGDPGDAAGVRLPDDRRQVAG